MYFGVDYYPEHWVYPYAGTAEQPESRWQEDVQLMVAAGVNVVRMGEFSWGLCEPEEGKYNFGWLKRAMDVMARAGIKVVLGTPTAAPPIWLAKKYPEILPLDERGLTRHEGTRRACCLNSDVYWDFCRRIIRAMATAPPPNRARKKFPQLPPPQRPRPHAPQRPPPRLLPQQRRLLGFLPPHHPRHGHRPRRTSPAHRLADRQRPRRP